jgi:hypothetical protein
VARLASAALALGVYFLSRRSIFFGCLAGALAIAATAMWQARSML